MRVGKPSPTRKVNQSYTHGPWSDILFIVDKYGAYHGMYFHSKTHFALESTIIDKNSSNYKQD